jgi:hypothetical protein
VHPISFEQGDQIGHIFAGEAVVYIRHPFGITEAAQIIGLLFSEVHVVGLHFG